VRIEPQPEECEEYRQAVATPQLPHPAPGAAEWSPAQTADGRRIELMANASSPAEARLAVAGGAEGIGLLRTEFLLAALGDTTPDEDALAVAYGGIFTEMGKRPIIVRAMDAGGDKPLPYLDFEREANPFLGWRGIRILLDRPGMFAEQTRAVLRAAAQHGSDVRLMFPMVSGLEELSRARQLVEQIYAEERAELAHPLQIGVMIEVPSAALMVDVLARTADFFSLGTNDLLQYTLACDRGNPRVSHLCRLAHPAILRLIETVVRAAHAHGRRVGVCGEAAGDPVSMALLIGLGVDELSVGAARVSATREQLGRLDYAALAALTAESLSRATSDEVLDLIAPLVA
jgi:phosphoenolpyruvate-protein kinase (PTS system EI component)